MNTDSPETDGDLRSRRPDLGLPPGSAVYVGERKPTELSLCAIGYDPIGSWIKAAPNVEELLKFKNPGGITWINVNGLKDSESINRLATAYGIHPLTVEDILNTNHRPKVEEFDDYVFITLKSITWKTWRDDDSDRAGEPLYEQVSIVLFADTVITFQEDVGDTFDPIRRRIEQNLGRIRKMGPDYLAYGLVDSIIDSYFIVLEQLGNELEDFEARADQEGGRTFMHSLQGVKADVMHMRRAVWPLRESVSAWLRIESDIISEELSPFLKDLHDNVVQAAETVESYRDITSSIMEVHLSFMSARLNEVMKVLTIISTIFIPLTFIVGVYGMNFEHMPELAVPWAYPLVWAVMISLGLSMLAFFKRRKWM